jgi:hypothetical protein
MEKKRMKADAAFIIARNTDRRQAGVLAGPPESSVPSLGAAAKPRTPQLFSDWPLVQSHFPLR